MAVCESGAGEVVVVVVVAFVRESMRCWFVSESLANAAAGNCDGMVVDNLVE